PPPWMPKKPAPPADDPKPMRASLKEPWSPGEVPSVFPVETPVVYLPGGLGGPGSDGATTFFQVPARGKKIVYVIDGSSSMCRDGALAAACRELRESVKKLPPDARFQVIVYNNDARFLLP